MTEKHSAEQADPASQSNLEQAPAGKENLGETMAHKDTSSKIPRPPTASTAEQWIGRRLERYELRKLLGTGGMGVVFLAHDTMIERDVAIKMLPQELSANETSLARFLSEAKAAGKLTHANAVGIYEVDQEGDTYYLVMEYVGGGTIEDELERGGLSVLAATQIVADACRGLAAAHAVGLVHRDIKPANLLRAADGSVKIADFGLAKQTLGATMNLTTEGAVAGTPYFMSPEQCECVPVDKRSDIYSLGATYFTLLTGQHPYQDAGSIVQIMYAHVSGAPLEARQANPGIPAACDQIVKRATAKNPDDRYQSADEMLADLNAVIATLSGTSEIRLPSQSGISPVHAVSPHAGKPSRRGFLAAAGLGAAGLALAGFGAWALWSGKASDDSRSGGATPAPLAAAFSGPPIKVGVLHSLTGSMEESESPVVDATLMAIDEINETGGLMGRKVEAVVRDGRSDPETFADEARKLILDDKVSTVFGGWTSASRKTMLPVFERHDGLLVYPVQYEGLEESPNVIYMGATPNQQIIPALDWAFAFQRKRKFFLVGSDYVFPRTANAIIRDELAELGGEVVGEEYLPLGSYDVDGVIEAIVEAQPDVILNTINGDSNVPFFRRLRAAGITPDKTSTISFSIGEQELRRLNPAEMAGDYAAWNYFQSLDTPENQAFVERFRKRYGSQRVLTDPMEAAYIGVKLWADAVRQAESDKPDDIRRAFVDQKINAPEGEVKIDPATQHAFKTPRIGKVDESGQFRREWADVEPRPPVPYPKTRSKEAWQEFLANLYAGWGEQWAAPSQ
ncbi:MAG: serine/threonine protein kinase [Planctomycetota bacterium]|nr:MAG: serine/threonine protein kinase [Planctomycetota bacterium]